MVSSDYSPAESTEEEPSREDEILRETNKRMTLNLLIQGAAMHSFLTGHHIVSRELEAERKGITKVYDRFSVALALNYFIGDMVPLYGRPSRFWKNVDSPKNPFHQHRLFSEYGCELWKGSKRFLIKRAWSKWVIAIPVIHYVQLMYYFLRTYFLERSRRERLTRIAEEANSQMWGIDVDRLEGSLTMAVAFGNLQEPRTQLGRMTRQGAIGYGGVERRYGRFQVVAKAWNWCLVLHELTKGTVELICLHGLNHLDDELYHLVTSEADQLEYETWMLQAGSEMWRRFLASIPEGRELPDLLMRIARLDPDHLEELMIAVAQQSPEATEMMKHLSDED
ncbi:MAG: hypothetical protein HUJ26_24230 [Planctomycetaceae bacterium]|nr:hypothetical protein [Planctomycetaceae bacterium]